jgi:DNA repair protein RecN (Recombination protein N)
MLRRLTIKNFAIIDEQTLELEPGLNVLTGETGAGKSILIEALGFLLGARASSSWLRTGAARLEVTGWFDKDDFPKEVATQFKITESPVMLRRELDASGKTRAIINSQSAPVAALAALGDCLVDFHGQHEHQTLLKPAVQLDLLDRFGGYDDETAKTAEAYDRWSALRAQLESSQMSEEERRRRIEIARFQLQELNEANLKAGEEEELETSLPRLKNAERLKGFAAGAYEGLYEQEGSSLSTLLKAERALVELAKVDPSEDVRRMHDRLEEARLALDEVAHELGAYRDRLDVDPAKLDGILGRLDALSRLKKKYGQTVELMIEFRDKTTEELQRMENAAQTSEELAKQLAEAETALAATCEILHAQRRKAAKKLETQLLKELKVLGMPNAEFSVAVEMEEGRYARTGSDAVDFLLAPNPGEPLKPVKAIASGGELSRVMLALKTVFAKADRVPTLVFDEVDAGIGGSVARAVGEKLAALGRARQVLCVTHLPQVACFGRAHFWVGKIVAGGRTKVAVERLEGGKRLEALALMLGGREATAASRKHAKELLEASTQ